MNPRNFGIIGAVMALANTEKDDSEALAKRRAELQREVRKMQRKRKNPMRGTCYAAHNPRFVAKHV